MERTPHYEAKGDGFMFNVTIPQLGLTMKECKIVEWVVKEGESVKKEQIILIIETQKVTYEVAAKFSGIIHIVVPEGETVPVGEVVALLAESQNEYENIGPEEKFIKSEKATVEEKLIEPVNLFEKDEAIVHESEQKIRITPVALKLAKEQEINLNTLIGTGPAGKITKTDILNAINMGKNGVQTVPTFKEPIEEWRTEPLSNMKKTIAKRLSDSARIAPHVFLFLEVDMSEVLRLREILLPEIERKTKLRLTYTDILIKITSCAIEENSIFNSVYVEDQIKIFNKINIGFAVALDGGLVVPVVRDISAKSFTEVVKARADLLNRAREGKLVLDELESGTFTVQNVGILVMDFGTAILNPPQSGLLSLYKVVKKPVVINDEIKIRPMAYLELSYDHRIIDGAIASKFLEDIKAKIENPYLLLQ